MNEFEHLKPVKQKEKSHTQTMILHDMFKGEKEKLTLKSNKFIYSRSQNAQKLLTFPNLYDTQKQSV